MRLVPRGTAAGSAVGPGARSGGNGGNEEKGASATLGLGPLIGLNGNTPDLTLKLRLDVDL